MSRTLLSLAGFQVIISGRFWVIAEGNSHFTLNPKKFDAQYPLLFTEIGVLLDRALEIGNRYSLLFDASAHATMMVGRDDYLNVLQAIREHVQAYERRLEEEWKRLGAATIHENS
jgi:hypothetical protein